MSGAKRLRTLEDEDARLKKLLAREGLQATTKMLLRIYRGEDLKARRRSGQKRAVGTSGVAGPTNQRWSLDSVSDALTASCRLRILLVVDDPTRACLTLLARTSLSDARTARELDTLVARQGRPSIFVSDNDTELTSAAILRRSQGQRAAPGTTFSPASQPRTPSWTASLDAYGTSA